MSKQVFFKVLGPYSVHHTKEPGGRVIADPSIERFWHDHEKWEKHIGCYVFAMSAGRGSKPWYVGKTRKGFKKEIFTPHKLHYYTQAMVKYKRGKPVIYFVTVDRAVGKPNDSKIKEVEKYLINIAMSRNPDLLNRQDASVPEWGIKGIVRSKKGKVSAGTKQFRAMMGVPKT